MSGPFVECEVPGHSRCRPRGGNAGDGGRSAEVRPRPHGRPGPFGNSPNRWARNGNGVSKGNPRTDKAERKKSACHEPFDGSSRVLKTPSFRAVSKTSSRKRSNAGGNGPGVLGVTTRSHPRGQGLFVRNASRVRRLNKFRWTAPPCRRATTMPNRAARGGVSQRR